MVASCLNLERKLDDLSASSTKEFEKAGRRLEALQNIFHGRVTDELDGKKSLKRLNERLSDEISRNIYVLGKVAKVISELPLCTSEPLVWAIEKWSELKQDAESKGKAVALCENPKYFYGYFIHPGICMVKRDGDVTLHLCYHVCQGSYDSLLNWPFRKNLRLDLLNAEGKDIPECITVNSSLKSDEAKERPTTARSDMLFSKHFIKVTDVERNGCVENDNVSAKLTVSQL